MSKNAMKLLIQYLSLLQYQMMKFRH